MLDESFGIIPLKLNHGSVEVLVVQHLDTYGGHWAFPKGHKNGGETNEEAALRELEEETGLRHIDLVQGAVFEETYYFIRGNSRIDKKVIYYLGWITQDEPLKLQEIEIQNALWVPMQLAGDKVTYAGAKQVLREVREFLQATKKVSGWETF
jgi:bis(5'-nucleosidyl)-tetraphosphatase